MKKFLMGFIVALVLVPVAVWCYVNYGNPPVAVSDPPFPMERQIVKTPMHARIDREMPRNVPIAADETNLEAGAHIYRQNCAACHGLPGQPSEFAAHMYPDAPQLWKAHRPGVVGVSDDPAGETYWKVDNGIRLTGMPAFNKILTQTQMWQVSLLLANADKPMPASVQNVLQPPLMPDMQNMATAPAATATQQNRK
jgi:thiosulfate dehydrogenase